MNPTATRATEPCFLSSTSIQVLLLSTFLSVLILTSANTRAEILEHEYKLIAAVIDHGVGTSEKRPVLNAQTVDSSVPIVDPTSDRAVFLEELDTTARAFGEWSRLNRSPHELKQTPPSKSKLQMMTSEKREQIFKYEDPAENWRQFNAAYPNNAGIIRVSRPGVDDVNGAALVYIEFECGDECGSGRLINLKRNSQGDWIVGSGSLVWITAPP